MKISPTYQHFFPSPQDPNETNQRQRRSPGSDGGAAGLHPFARLRRILQAASLARPERPPVRAGASEARHGRPPFPLRHGWTPAAEASSLDVSTAAPWTITPGLEDVTDVFTGSLEVQTLFIFPYSNLMNPLSSESEKKKKPILYIS
jgi:hypothetical protein